MAHEIGRDRIRQVTNSSREARYLTIWYQNTRYHNIRYHNHLQDANAKIQQDGFVLPTAGLVYKRWRSNKRHMMGKHARGTPHLTEFTKAFWSRRVAPIEAAFRRLLASFFEGSPPLATRSRSQASSLASGNTAGSRKHGQEM